MTSCGINEWCCAGQEGLETDKSCCKIPNRVSTLEPFPYSTILAAQVGKPSKTTSSPSGQSTKSTTTSPSKATSGAAGTSSGSTSSGQSGNNNGQTDNGGVSETSKIAIGVAVPVGLLLLAALAFFIYRSKRQGRRLEELTSGKEDNQLQQPPVVAAKYRPELDSQELQELEWRRLPPELPEQRRFELDTARG